MPDIDTLFLKLLEVKNSIYVALQLGHEDTKKVDRWAKEKKVPESKKYMVYTLLKSEGMTK